MRRDSRRRRDRPGPSSSRGRHAVCGIGPVEAAARRRRRSGPWPGRSYRDRLRPGSCLGARARLRSVTPHLDARRCRALPGQACPGAGRGACLAGSSCRSPRRPRGGGRLRGRGDGRFGVARAARAGVRLEVRAVSNAVGEQTGAGGSTRLQLAASVPPADRGASCLSCRPPAAGTRTVGQVAETIRAYGANSGGASSWPASRDGQVIRLRFTCRRAAVPAPASRRYLRACWWSGGARLGRSVWGAGVAVCPSCSVYILPLGRRARLFGLGCGVVNEQLGFRELHTGPARDETSCAARPLAPWGSCSSSPRCSACRRGR